MPTSINKLEPQKQVRRKTQDIANDIKNTVIPKPGEMVATTNHLCKKCEYGCSMGGGVYQICDYYVTTGKLRGCKSGFCDKFKVRVGTQRTLKYLKKLG